MRTARFVLALAAVLTCTACSTDGLVFRVDERVEITAPRDDENVSLPFTLRWSVEDFEVVEPGTPARQGTGLFAVFIDETPMRPGASLDDLRPDDAACDVDCTEESYFASLGIYTTTDTELTIDALPAGEDDEIHRATVVLLDSTRKRLGESAWHVDFRVPEEKEDAP